MRRIVPILLALCAGAVALATEDIDSQTVREYLLLLDTDGNRVSGSVRAYHTGADSSLLYHQSDLVEIAGDVGANYYWWAKLRTTDPTYGTAFARDAAWDIRWIGHTGDSLLARAMWLPGYRTTHGGVDSTSIGTGEVQSVHVLDETLLSDDIQDSTLQGVDHASRSIQNPVLAIGGVDYENLSDAVKDSIAAGAGGGGGDVYGVGVLHDFLEVDADSSGGNPHLGLNLTDAPAGADSFLVSTGSGLRFSKGDGSGGGAGDLTEVKVGPGLIVSSGTGPIPKVKVDSLAVLDLGNSGSAGTIDIYDGSTKKTTVTTSPTLGSNTSFYLPNTTGSTNAIYQKTGTGAQMTLSPSGLTSVSATTLYGQSKVVAMSKGELEMRDISGNYQAFDADTLDHNQIFRMPTIDGTAYDVLMLNEVSGSNPTILKHEYSRVLWEMLDSAVQDSIQAGGGGGGGDITGVGVSHSFLTVDADSLSGNPNLGLNLTATDGRYVNEAQANSITASMITTGEVGTDEIATDGVGSAEIATGAVGSGELGSGAVADSTKIAASAVTTTRIAANAVYSDDVKDGQIKLADLAANSVDSTKVAAGTLALSDLKSTTAAAANEVLSATSTGIMNWQPLADAQLPGTITIGTGESIDVSGTGHIDATMVNVQARAVSGTIPAGSVVYAASYNPSGWLEVGLADANGTGTMPAIGIAEVQLTTGSGGSVITNGIIGGQDTDPGAIGPIFVSETAGAWTTTLPSTVGTEVQELGYIVRVHNSNGEILVNPIDSDEMQNLESAKIWVGNASNRPTAVAMSSDATMANTGAVTIAANAVAAAELAAGAVADSTELGSGAVTATKIGANAIHTGHIKDGQVKSGDIAAGAIADSTKLAAGSVTRTKIATGSITAVQIMDGQVKSGELAAGAVADSTKIGNSAVTATKIAASAVKNGNLGTGAVSSTKIAAGAVADSTKLGTGSVTVTKIGTGAVYSGSIKDGQVKSADLASGAIADSTKLAASSVTTTRIAANAVYSDDIKDGQVQSGDLAAGAIVDSTKLAASSVTTTKISANAVYSDDIKDGQVKTADIAASAIDSSKIATGAVTARTIKANDSPSNDEVLAYTKGDFYWTPAGAGDITGVGTSNDFLKVADSTSGNPKLGLYVTDAPAAADSFLVSTGSNLRFSKGTSGGDQVSVNSTATTNPDLDDAAPAAPSGGVNVKWQTASNNVSAYLDYNSSHIDAMRTKPWYFEDFIGALNSGAKIWPWSLSALASGSLAATEGTINHPGIQKVTSSSSSNSGMGISGASADAIIFGGGECFEASVQFKRLKNVTVVVGFNDQWSGGDLESSADGGFAYFNTDSLLTLRSCENSTRADADTTYTVSRDTWYRIRVCTTSDGNRLDGWCWNDSGTLLWHESLTDNGSTILIPDDTGRSFTSGVCVVHETTTTGIPLLWVDYMAQWYNNRALTR